MSLVAPQPNAFGCAFAVLVAAHVEQEHAVAVADEHPRLVGLPIRVGNEITAAPLREGTYQAARSSRRRSRVTPVRRAEVGG